MCAAGKGGCMGEGCPARAGWGACVHALAGAAMAPGPRGVYSAAVGSGRRTRGTSR